MRQSEITVLLPPATADTIGTITARTYPITIAPKGGTTMVRLDGVNIAPVAGIAEVWVRGAGSDRRQVVERQTAIPQAVGSTFRPMELTLVNLNTEAAAQLVIELSVMGPITGLGSPARFGGRYPEGTDGQRDTYTDTAGDAYVTCNGPGFDAWMVTNAATVTRNIRDIIGRTRILPPAGTGSIPIGGSSDVTIIVKKDGLVLEASADTIDLLSAMFEVGIPTPGTVRILDFADGSVQPAHLAWPGPWTLNGLATISEAAPSGTLATASIDLPAGTFNSFVMFNLQADGDGIADGLIIVRRGASDLVGRAARYETGVDATHLVVGTEQFTLAAPTTITWSGVWTPSSNSINGKGGQLSGLVWKIA